MISPIGILCLQFYNTDFNRDLSPSVSKRNLLLIPFLWSVSVNGGESYCFSMSFLSVPIGNGIVFPSSTSFSLSRKLALRFSLMPYNHLLIINFSEPFVTPILFVDLVSNWTGKRANRT